MWFTEVTHFVAKVEVALCQQFWFYWLNCFHTPCTMTSTLQVASKNVAKSLACIINNGKSYTKHSGCCDEVFRLPVGSHS